MHRQAAGRDVECPLPGRPGQCGGVSQEEPEPPSPGERGEQKRKATRVTVKEGLASPEAVSF